MKIKLYAFVSKYSAPYMTQKDMANPVAVLNACSFSSRPGEEGSIPVGEVEIEIEAPSADFMLQGVISSLRMRQVELRAEATAKVDVVETLIQNLQALPAPEDKQ